jgi:ubiquinone/menaquinone biosynthesis C-methylase UbiE
MSGRRSRPTPVSATTEQEAALYDSVVVPRYSSLFAQMLLQQIPDNARATVLDIGCGTGHPTFEVLRRLDDGGRVVGIDRDNALLDIARRKALDLAGKRLFFKVGLAEELEFGDQVFDIVIGNLVMPQLDSPADALAEMKRVLVPSGQLLLTRATEGTFEEVLDMLREVALREDLPSVEQRVEQVAARYPSATAFANQVRAAGFADVEVTEETFRLPFRTAREIFEHPLIGFVGMSEWRWIAGLDDGGRRVIEDVAKSLDTYFAGGPLSLTVRGCLVSARSPRALGG